MKKVSVFLFMKETILLTYTFLYFNILRDLILFFSGSFMAKCCKMINSLLNLFLILRFLPSHVAVKLTIVLYTLFIRKKYPHYAAKKYILLEKWTRKVTSYEQQNLPKIVDLRLLS